MFDRRTRAPVVLMLVAMFALAACNQAQDPELQGLASQAIGDRYIVVLNDAPIPGVPSVGHGHADRVARAYGLQPSHTYGAAIVGFAAQIPAGRLHALRRDARVAYVEPDGPVRLYTEHEQTTPTGIDRISATLNVSIGIDGIDQRVDVGVAVIDTGIDFQHPDLNVVAGVTCTVSGGGGPPWSRKSSCDPGGDDDHYHGTHVAGTIAALDNGLGVVGVAPGARLYAVKVLDSSGSGYESTIVAGIDWVTANANAKDISVANMSLGGSGYSRAEYDAIQAAVDVGVAFAVAAGNSDDDASKYSPAAFDNVLTVSALADFDGKPGGLGVPTCRNDQDDTLADFSNWGSAVQIAAPGVCILSTYPLERGDYGTISGTSMASPHVAGALALLASSSPPTSAANVDVLYKAVIDSGNFDWTDDSGDGVKEPLLDVSDEVLFKPAFADGGGDTTNSPPTAAFTFSCTELACDFDASGSSDTDGSIAGYAWDLGDGNSASGVTTSHVYSSDRTYTVVLTVTDNVGASDVATADVTVSAPASGDFTLSATGYKVKGVHHTDLAWSPHGVPASVDVFRNGSKITTTDNDGAYTDATTNKGGAKYSYQVCEAGTATCTNVVEVVF